MSEEAFLQALLDDPDDRTTRLVFADWLEDRDDPSKRARGEFLRVQTELAGWIPDHRRRNELLRRERQLRATHEAEWLGPLREMCHAWHWEGGVAHIRLDAGRLVDPAFGKVAKVWFPRAWVRTVKPVGDVHAPPDWTGCETLRWVTALDLDAEYDLESENLLSSNHLERLTQLDLGNCAPRTPYIEILRNSPFFERLQWLDLRNLGLTPSDLPPLLSLLGRSRLRWLDLHGNDLGTSNLTQLIAWQEQHASSAPRRFTNSIGMNVMRIPAGSFLMGSPESEAQRYDDEGPQHAVTLTQSFYLGANPVTQCQYERVMRTNPSQFTGEEWDYRYCPVDSVSWLDALEFCRRLSALPEEKRRGRRYRLPTEAEWEHACRAGGAPSDPFHLGRSLSSWQANFNGGSPYGGAEVGGWLERPEIVGRYQPTAFGLYDMHGNVWEWCADGMNHDFYRKSPGVDPIAPPATDERVCRGGSWHSPAHYCRSADRGRDRLDVRDRYYGFRVACDVERPEQGVVNE